jgi:hypothetical protein
VTALRDAGDAGDAGDAALPLDAGAEPPFDWDAEVFIPIYALVAPPPRTREQSDAVPAFARPDPAVDQRERDHSASDQQNTSSPSSGGRRIST